MRFEYLGPCNEKVNELFDENVKLKAEIERYKRAIAKLKSFGLMAILEVVEKELEGK
jgi:predicted RNase H-like nuclease (RuvC/YqgF family)